MSELIHFAPLGARRALCYLDLGSADKTNSCLNRSLVTCKGCLALLEPEEPEASKEMTPGSLTEDELKADDMILELLNHIREKVMLDGESFKSHMKDVIFHIHSLQTIVMSQAAARAYPERFRLLGQ